MNNTKLYPFERNRYYAGKMLTSSDFQAEQTYFNNKRRFINQLMYGPGVICGCGVFSLDDLSILVESGAALDGLGREIVIDSSIVKKLSAIDGFEQLKTEDACLCVRYKEDPIHMVYTMNQGTGEEDQEYEYNRVSESYQLFLMDCRDDREEYELQNDFFTTLILLDNEDFEVRLTMPATVCRGKNVKLILTAEKKTSSDKRLSYRATLQTPVFLAPDGEHQIVLEISDVSLGQGECLNREYWMHVQEVSVLETSLLIDGRGVSALVGDEPVQTESGKELSVSLTDRKPADLVNEEVAHISLEMKDMSGVKDYVRLAKLKLVRTDSAYIIEDVVEKGVKNYIAAPAQETLRSAYLEYFSKDVDIFRPEGAGISVAQTAGRDTAGSRRPEMASGVLEIPLGENARRGDICYSGEIMHGLGKGNVYVQVGYEYISEDPAIGTDSRNTIYGNSQLFKDAQAQAVDVETAVKVLNDRGSFIVAARLLGNVSFLSLTFRWVAVKFPSGSELGMDEDYRGKSISLDAPTVVMGPNESHYFQVRYNNMDACSIAYELTEEGSGEITSEGVYTSPAKEGVYEIRVYCVDMPVICTYAYAIVKKEGSEIN